MIVALVVVGAGLLVTSAILFGFHCGFVWGRHRISAYEFWKRGGVV